VTWRLLRAEAVLPRRFAVERFDQNGAGELIYPVEHHNFISVTLNGYDVPMPSD
jgi:hypothetical protein